MEAIINEYIARELVNDPKLLPLQNDTQLVESGILDSLSLLKLLVFLEEQFGILVDEFEVLPENFASVEALCTYVRARQHVQESQ